MLIVVVVDDISYLQITVRVQEDTSVCMRVSMCVSVWCG